MKLEGTREEIHAACETYFDGWELEDVLVYAIEQLSSYYKVGTSEAIMFCEDMLEEDE